MGLFIEKKFSRLVLTAYLAVAIMGAFSFSVMEPLREIDFWADKPLSSSFLAPIDHDVDCLAENTPLMGRAGGYSFSPLRNGSLRVLMLPGTRNIGLALSHSSLATIETMNSLSTAYTIPLKLRI